MEKNKIISLSTTLLYSFVLVISFLCFYHSIVESSWLLEIIVSLFVLIGVNLLSYKTKTKEIIFPIVMTFIIGIIYSFQSFYYGFWGIINYCIQWYNVQFDDARNLMMTKAITTSHIQAFSLVVILFITYFIYRSIKKEKMMGIILIFSIVFAFTLWIDRFSFIGGSLCIITLLMIWMYYQNKVINSKTVQWLVIISIIFVAVALPGYQDNLSLQQIKKEVLQQVEDLRYGKDNLPQGNLKQASIIHENEEERLQLAVSQRKNLYLKGFVGSTLQNNQWQDLKRASYNGKHEGMLKWLENKNFSSSYQYSLYEKLSQLDDTSQKTDIDVNDTLANYSITVNESGNPIIVNGTYKKATSKTYKDVNLSNFIPKIQINEAVKGRNIYKNYCKMMQEFSNYLKEQGVTSNDKLFEGKTKEYIKEWMMQKTGANKSDFITNLPKLYASIYPDIELDSLLEVFGTYNKDFDKEKYKYITPCMYISDSTRENLTYKDFFEDEGYKKYVFILVGDKAKKGDRPTDIWALLDNTTVEDDQDTWLIPKSKISTKILENKTYSEFYKIISGNEWIYYTTSK